MNKRNFRNLILPSNLTRQKVVELLRKCLERVCKLHIIYLSKVNNILITSLNSKNGFMLIYVLNLMQVGSKPERYRKLVCSNSIQANQYFDVIGFPFLDFIIYDTLI